MNCVCNRFQKFLQSPRQTLEVNRSVVSAEAKVSHKSRGLTKRTNAHLVRVLAHQILVQRTPCAIHPLNTAIHAQSQRSSLSRTLN